MTTRIWERAGAKRNPCRQKIKCHTTCHCSEIVLEKMIVGVALVFPNRALIARGQGLFYRKCRAIRGHFTQANQLKHGHIST